MDAIAEPLPVPLLYEPVGRYRVGRWAGATIVIVVTLALNVVLPMWLSPHHPSRASLAAASWAHGWVPLWDGSSGCPLLAKGNLAAFSPSLLPLILMGPSPSAWALRSLIVLAIAASGAWRWGGRRGLTPAVRTAIACAFVIVIGALGTNPDRAASEALIWLPWCALAVESLADALTIPRVLAAAVALAMPLLVANVWAVGLVLAACVIAVALRVARRREWTAGAIAIGGLAFVAVVALGLSALVWLPRWEEYQHPHNASVTDALAPQATMAAKAEWCVSRAVARAKAATANPQSNSTVYLDTDVPADLQEWADRAKVETKPPTGALARLTAGSTPKLESSAETLGHYQAHVSAGSIGWVVFRAPYDPAWTARIVRADQFGRQTADAIVLPADGRFCAVPTDGQGAADVLLEYHPLSFRRGALVSGACAAFLLLLLTIHLGFRRKAV